VNGEGLPGQHHDSKLRTCEAMTDGGIVEVVKKATATFEAVNGGNGKRADGDGWCLKGSEVGLELIDNGR
jgi:hypothetical protein